MSQPDPHPSPQIETSPVPYHGSGRLLHRCAARPRALLLAFHGYAENAERMIERLATLPSAEDWTLAALEAPHLFYVRGRRIGGCWMTRLDRERAIDSLLDYAGAALERLDPDAALPLALLGFSQGGALACRLALGAKRPAQALLMLGSDVPPEIWTQPELIAKLPPLLLARGRDDLVYPDTLWARECERLQDAGAAVRDLRFEGGHEWNEPFAREADAFLCEHLNPETP